MSSYLWIYIIAVVAVVSLIIFLMTFGKDHFYIKKLKKKKTAYIINLVLLIFSIVDVALIIYLFMVLKEQIGIFV